MRRRFLLTGAAGAAATVVVAGPAKAAPAKTAPAKTAPAKAAPETAAAGDETVDGSLTVGDGSVSRSLTVMSSFAGGDDVPGSTTAYDSTGRINLLSYQRAYVRQYGETIRNFLMRKDAKAMTAWYGPDKLYDANRDAIGDWTDPNQFSPWVWTGAHYEANDQGSLHAHWEVEVPDSKGALQGRFEILFADQATGKIGLDTTKILTNLAHFVVRCSNNQQLRLQAVAGWEKAIVFTNDTDATRQRWKIRSTGEAESGANAGSNFELARYDDAGTMIDQPIIVNRATGQITLCGRSGTGGGVVVNRAGTGVALAVNSTGAAGQGVLVSGADTASAAYQTKVTGDTVNRFRVMTDGKLEWGGGTGRDTNLYRAGTDVLKTDDSLHVGAQLRHLGTGLGFFGANAVAKPAVSGSRGGNAALTSLITALTSLGLITNSTS
ncbi:MULTISPECIES: hypothetical protein [Catenuloplanes]|uniref:Uncharacterized protein n=1 Tax=Catenuloplanes niger TaxID=587534 RepID=A0AAE3ZSD7_9ACTN|nr:hypothetical protein [Catenuloplanes niger]MDR7325057.1 hypothetical protein [Catenuloplanes niger]